MTDFILFEETLRGRPTRTHGKAGQWRGLDARGRGRDVRTRPGGLPGAQGDVSRQSCLFGRREETRRCLGGDGQRRNCEKMAEKERCVRGKKRVRESKTRQGKKPRSEAVAARGRRGRGRPGPRAREERERGEGSGEWARGRAAGRAPGKRPTLRTLPGLSVWIKKKKKILSRSGQTTKSAPTTKHKRDPAPLCSNAPWHYILSVCWLIPQKHRLHKDSNHYFVQWWYRAQDSFCPY